MVFLDAGPLGLASNPRQSPINLQCARWLQGLLASGTRVVIPEISDYEIRRELLRAGKSRGIKKLDDLALLVEYLPLTTLAMREAAAIWATARNQGQPTAGDRAIDADVILAAQAITFGIPNFVIATTNVGHLSRFAPAELWPAITP